MRIKLLVVGKTNEKYLKQGIEKYKTRIEENTSKYTAETEDISIFAEVKGSYWALPSFCPGNLHLCFCCLRKIIFAHK